jgi:hypothetical protein
MRSTIQIRISRESHAFLSSIANGGMTISKLADKAISLLKKEKEKDLLEYQHKMAILYPNRKIKSGHNVSKTQSAYELSTALRKIQKDMRSGDFWTSSKYLPDNDNETKV